MGIKIKLYLLDEDMITYLEIAELTKKIPELISYYSKFVEYKVNIQKSIAFLYTSNKKLKSEI